MKKLFIAIGLSSLIFSCQEEQVLTTIDTGSSEVEKAKTLEEAGILLLNDKAFRDSYNSSITLLKGKKEALIKSVNLSEIRHEGGIIMIDSEEEIRPVYESISEADESWQEVFANEATNLINIAFENPELTGQLGGEDATSVAIGQLLRSDGLDAYNVQAGVADKMPVQTLWSRARSESEEWLRSAGANPDWNENPDRKYIGNAYERMFFNANSQIYIMDSLYNPGDRFDYMSAENETSGRLEGSGCRTWWYSDEHTDNNGQPTCLWVNTYVTNVGIWKTYGVEGKGWIWAWGRWHEWGFNKLLTMGGRIVVHNLQLQDPCDPLLARNVGWGRERWSVFLSIDNVEWGLDRYLGTCRNNFWGVISGRGRGTSVTMN